MSASQYISESFFNPLDECHTEESIRRRMERVERHSDTWWGCGAWLIAHGDGGEWPSWITEDGEVDRDELRGFIKEHFPDHPEYLQNPDRATMPLALRVEVLHDQQGCCWQCGVEEWRLKKRLHAHRIRPGRLGGKYVKGNVRLLCAECHIKAPEHRDNKP